MEENSIKFSNSSPHHHHKSGKASKLELLHSGENIHLDVCYRVADDFAIDYLVKAIDFYNLIKL